MSHPKEILPIPKSEHLKGWRKQVAVLWHAANGVFLIAWNHAANLPIPGELMNMLDVNLSDVEEQIRRHEDFHICCLMRETQALALGAAGLDTIPAAAIEPLRQVADFADQAAALIEALEDDSPEARAAAEANFNVGRDLAVAMMRETETVNDIASSTFNNDVWREYRGGRAQNAYVAKYIQQIIERPALLRGFAAILSGTADMAQPNPDAFATVTLAETEAGGRGEDGTIASEPDLWAYAEDDNKRRDELDKPIQSPRKVGRNTLAERIGTTVEKPQVRAARKAVTA